MESIKDEVTRYRMERICPNERQTEEIPKRRRIYTGDVEKNRMTEDLAGHGNGLELRLNRYKYLKL